MVFSLFDYLATLNEKELLDYLSPIGEPKIAARKAKIQATSEAVALPRIASRHLFIDFQDNPNWHVPVVYLAEDGSEDRYVSDVCMALCKQFPDAKFSACYTSQGTWSLRSDKFGNNTDVGAFAREP